MWSPTPATNMAHNSMAPVLSMSRFPSSAPVAVTVTNPLTVAISTPATNSKYSPPAGITLTANANDGNPNAAITQVAYYSGPTLIGSAGSAPYSVSWNNVPTGRYPVTATVTDSQGLTKTSAAINVVVDTPPTVTLTSPPTGASYVGLATIPLSADVADTDGSISTVQFYRGGTLIGTATAAPYSFTWANVAPGTYTVTARVTDNLGAVTSSAGATVTVTVTNPVTVSLASPLNNARFIPPASIDLTANAGDSNGAIARVDFYAGATLIGGTSSAPYTVPWTNVAAGMYKITAKATDSQGITKTSPAINIVVDTSPNVALSAPLNNTAYAAPATITLNADVSDPDGSISKVQFFRGNTLLATLTSAPYTTT
jgi:hypothetical protein